MKYRSRIDIAADILGAASGGVRKTKIMYGVFLSYPQLKGYLELLTSSDLLEYDKDEKVYQTTEKGRHFLKLSNEMGSMLPLDKPTKAAIS